MGKETAMTTITSMAAQEFASNSDIFCLKMKIPVSERGEFLDVLKLEDDFDKNALYQKFLSFVTLNSGIFDEVYSYSEMLELFFREADKSNEIDFKIDVASGSIKAFLYIAIFDVLNQIWDGKSTTVSNSIVKTANGYDIEIGKKVSRH